MSDRPPLQFGLHTMLLATTVLAVLCGLVAWCGLLGWVGTAVIAVILAGAAGTFIGLLICSCAGLGFEFEDLKWDILKCVALEAIVVLLGYGLMSLSSTHYVLAPMPVVMAILIKLLWLDLEGVEILIVGFSSVCAIGIAASNVMYWMGG